LEIGGLKRDQIEKLIDENIHQAIKTIFSRWLLAAAMISARPAVNWRPASRRRNGHCDRPRKTNWVIPSSLIPARISEEQVAAEIVKAINER
jgi:hypothetical protein